MVSLFLLTWGRDFSDTGRRAELLPPEFYFKASWVGEDAKHKLAASLHSSPPSSSRPVQLQTDSMSNSDRVVLALGGAGTVGSGIVKALLDKGKLTETAL